MSDEAVLQLLIYVSTTDKLRIHVPSCLPLHAIILIPSSGSSQRMYFFLTASVLTILQVVEFREALAQQSLTGFLLWKIQD